MRTLMCTKGQEAEGALRHSQTERNSRASLHMSSRPILTSSFYIILTIVIPLKSIVRRSSRPSWTAY